MCKKRIQNTHIPMGYALIEEEIKDTFGSNPNVG